MSRDAWGRREPVSWSSRKKKPPGVFWPELEDSAALPEPRGDLKWIGIDLDDTLAQKMWTPENPTREIGPPIQRNVAKLVEAVEKGYKPVIHTSRGWTDYEAIETWLDHHCIPWKLILCGKPLFALYVDDRARSSRAASWVPGDPDGDKFDSQDSTT